MGKVWGGSSLRHGVIAATALVISLFSVSAIASLEGNFSGTTTSNLECSPQSFFGSSLSTTISLQATLVSPGVSTIIITIISGDYTYTGSGAANESGSTFFIGANGSLVATTGDSNVDGSYTGVPYTDGGSPITASLNPDGSLNFGSGDGIFTGAPCGGGSFFTNATTLLPVSAIGGAINTEITNGATVREAVVFHYKIQHQTREISRQATAGADGTRHSLRSHASDNQFMMEGATGLNAGDGSTIPYGFWGNYTYSDYDNDLSTTAFDGNNHSFLGGVDFAFWENTVLGVAFGYDNGDIDTTFNLGQIDTDSYTIAPYFGALLTDTLSIDFNMGYSRVEYDQFRTDPTTGGRVTSSPDADRWFGALNLNGVAYYDKWILGGRVGALWAKSVIDSFTESDGTLVAKTRNRVGEGVIAGDVAYSYQNYEPFLNLSYQYDFELTKLVVTNGPQPSDDPDDVLMRVGVRYFGDNGITGNLEYSKRFGRDDFDEDSFSITIRADY